MAGKEDIILETPRLLLREFLLSDAQDMYELNRDIEVVQYTGDHSFESLEAAEEFLRNYDPYSKTGMGRWLVIRKSDHACLGWCGLKWHEGDWIDLGYRFFKKYWNQGYASESSTYCLKYGFTKLKLDEIFATVMPENKASVRVLEKLGFRFLREINEELMGTSLFYGLKKEDWKTQDFLSD
ncbi:MAG: GNAT family N-acetyltransferase [Bacteroidota bacterium]